MCLGLFLKTQDTSIVASIPNYRVIGKVLPYKPDVRINCRGGGGGGGEVGGGGVFGE